MELQARKQPSMINVIFYFQNQQDATAEVRAMLVRMKAELDLQVVEVDVESQSRLAKNLSGRTPVLQTGPYTLYFPFEERELKVTLLAARDRQEAIDQYKAGGKPVRKINFGDRLGYWVTRHYLALFIFFFFLYAGLPFAAPVAFHNNLPNVGQVINTIYRPLCHQLAYRSWFLYGEQAYYPRELAHIQGVIAYEQATGNDPQDLLLARDITGNSVMGYKVVLCQRDIAIYGSIMLTAILFGITGRKWKTIPWYIWVFAGVLPIAIDGVSQIPGLAYGWPSWIPLRESTPFFRTLTGALFGSLTGIYLLPMLEETFQEARGMMERKISILQGLAKSQIQDQ